MNFESALELKSTLINQTLRKALTARAVVDRVMLSRRLAPEGKEIPPLHQVKGLSLGISLGKKASECKIAVRVQRKQLLESDLIERIRRKARNEIDLVYTGAVLSLSRIAAHRGRWYRDRRRPLEIGISVGHKDVTAGTLGAFVQKENEDGWYILSNNHVLADENRALRGDEVLQPGRVDGGIADERSIIGAVTDWDEIHFDQPNLMDAAIAQLDDSLEVEADQVYGIGKISGIADDFPGIFEPVRKLGRTTGLTSGRIRAVALDDVRVSMEKGEASFDNQIEIESTVPGQPFSLGGDSGSTIWNEDNLGVGLLFAGSEVGGSNGLGLTYANPLSVVFDSLGIRL